MSSFNSSAVIEMSIKATAMNKDRARVWVESAHLPLFGFVRHAPIDIVIGSDQITVTLSPSGSRKVAGRVRNGKAISILDICMPVSQRDAIRSGRDTFTVTISQGLITIR